MITNGMLTSLAPPAPPGPDGATAYGTPVVLNVRCQLSTVTGSQRYSIGEAVQDATAVMYVPKSALGGNVPQQGGQVVCGTDGGRGSPYRIEYVIDRQGGVSHWEVFLKL
jgi:hypothetical protein